MERFITPGALPALGAIFFLGSMLGGAIVGAFRLFFWNESRIEKTATRAVELALKSDTFEHFVERVASAAFTGRAEADNLFRAQLSADIRQMKSRADAQSQSIVEAHRRIDALLERMFAGEAKR